MVTNVCMKRKIFDSEIKQRSDNGYFSATDLVKAGNKWRILNGLSPFKMSEWLRNKSTIDFIETLKEVESNDIIITGKGRGNNTWIHPYLFIDMALAINPKLKIEVYSWLYDNLINYRNDSGDSYKKMTGALWITQENKSNFKICISNIANEIKIECDVKNWQEATEYQLQLRDKIHEYVAQFSDIIRDRDTLIRVSIKKAKEQISTYENKFAN